MGDARLVGVRQLPGAVGVEWPADRVPQPVLVVRGARVDLAGELREAIRRAGRRTVAEMLLGGRELRRALEHHRRGDICEALHTLLDRCVDDRPGERVVDLGQRERELVEVGDPADDRRQVDHVRAAVKRSASEVQLAQITSLDLAALAHPARRDAVIRDSDLEFRIGQQAPHDGRADRAGAARHEHARHQWVTSGEASSGAAGPIRAAVSDA